LVFASLILWDLFFKHKISSPSLFMTFTI
jgi:hypothetical protein